MGIHVRRQLRESIAQRLHGLPTTGTRVKAHAETVPARGEPELQVWITTEEAEVASLDYLQLRRVRVEVHGYVTGPLARQHDTLDDIALEVESALASNFALGATTARLAYAGCGIDIDTSGEIPAGEIRLDFDADIFTASDAPDVAISA